MTRQALGRGLDSLIPGAGGPASSGRSEGSGIAVTNLAVKKIKPNRYQPRRQFDEARLSELADSIRENGLVQPIVVSPDGDGYELIAGERRLRAAKLAGLDHVPAMVRKISDKERFVFSLLENLQREDLNPMEAAEGYKRLMSDFAFTQESVAKQVGMSRAAVANAVRLLGLPAEVQKAVRDGRISAGHARAILSLPTPAAQILAARRILRERMTVRESERLTPRRDRSSVKSSEHLAIEEKLRQALGTKVLINGAKKGRVEIYYYSLDDLDRIIRLLRRA